MLATRVEDGPHRWTVQRDYRDGLKALVDVLVDKTESAFWVSALATDTIVLRVPQHKDASVDPLLLSVNIVRPVEVQHAPSRKCMVNAYQVRQPGVDQHKDGGRAMMT